MAMIMRRKEMHMTKMKKIAGILLAGAIIPIFIGGCNSSSSTVDKGEGTKDVQGEVNTGEKKEEIMLSSKAKWIKRKFLEVVGIANSRYSIK